MEALQPDYIFYFCQNNYLSSHISLARNFLLGFAGWVSLGMGSEVRGVLFVDIFVLFNCHFVGYRLLLVLPYGTDNNFNPSPSQQSRSPPQIHRFKYKGASSNRLQYQTPKIIKMQAGQKKLAQIFKTFVEKNLAPQIKKLQGSLAEWNKFSALLLADNANNLQLQHFVDSLPVWGAGGGTANGSGDKLGLLGKKLDVEGAEGGFNPSKTFGGQRNKLIYNAGEDKLQNLDSRRESQRDESLRQRLNQNNQNILSNLQKLLKNLQQNQQAIESLAPKQPQPQNARLSRQPSIQYSQPQGNGFAVHSYNYLPSNHTQSQSHSQPHSHSQSFSHVPNNYVNVKSYY